MRQRLRAAFAVKPGDPVVADKVIAAGVALKVALGEQGFATAEIGEQDIVIDHEHRDGAAGACRSRRGRWRGSARSPSPASRPFRRATSG